MRDDFVADVIVAIVKTAHTGKFRDSKAFAFPSEKGLERWEDSKYSYNLIRPSYEPTFGLIIYSKRLDAPARAAIVEAIRLEGQEAPQRETERQDKKRD